MKESSKFIKFFRNQNPCHDIDNEKPSSVISNLNREGLSDSPYYNKKLKPTKHAHFLDTETLFKIG